MKKSLIIFFFVLGVFFIYPVQASFANFVNGASTETNDLPFIGSEEALFLNHNQNQYFFDPTKNALTTAGDFTLEAWIKVNSVPPGGYWIVTKDDGTTNRQFGLSAADIHKIALQVHGVGNINSNNASIPNGVWTYVAAVWHSSSSTADFYINGQYDSTIHSSQTIPSTGNNSELEVGRRGDGDNGTFDGEIAEVRIWNVARTSTQIVDNYNKHLIGNESGLIAYYPRWTPISLSVPYFSQRVSPWGPEVYDDAKTLGFSPYTMSRWGCAVTSAAMLLQYYGMTKLPDGTALDPGSLNAWLNNNDGFETGKDSDGAYSYINFAKIGSLTQQLYTKGMSTTKLEWHPLVGTRNASSDAILDSDLQQGDPDILFVHNASTSSHLIVATGKVNGIYTVNDPYWHMPDLSSFNNSYDLINRFVPSHTDLSFITLVINPSVQILVTNQQNQKSGSSYSGNTLSSYNQITNAIYRFDPPISNPGDTTQPMNLGIGVNSFLLPAPSGGPYNILLTTNKTVTYTLNIETFQQDGTSQLKTITGAIDKNSPKTLQLIFNQASPSATTITATTIQNVLNDIADLYQLKLINIATYQALTNILQSAQTDEKHNRMMTELTKLQVADTILLQQKGSMTQDTYTILHIDLQTLEAVL